MSWQQIQSSFESNDDDELNDQEVNDALVAEDEWNMYTTIFT